MFTPYLGTRCRQIHQCAKVGGCGGESPILALQRFKNCLFLQVYTNGETIHITIRKAGLCQSTKEKKRQCDCANIPQVLYPWKLGLKFEFESGLRTWRWTWFRSVDAHLQLMLQPGLVEKMSYHQSNADIFIHFIHFHPLLIHFHPGGLPWSVSDHHRVVLNAQT